MAFRRAIGIRRCHIAPRITLASARRLARCTAFRSVLGTDTGCVTTAAAVRTAGSSTIELSGVDLAFGFARRLAARCALDVGIHLAAARAVKVKFGRALRREAYWFARSGAPAFDTQLAICTRAQLDAAARVDDASTGRSSKAQECRRKRNCKEGSKRRSHGSVLLFMVEIGRAHV